MSVFAPGEICGGEAFLITLWLYEPRFADAAHASAARSGASEASSTLAVMSLTEHVDIVITVGSPLSVDAPHARMTWLGGMMPVPFEVRCAPVEAPTRCPAEILVISRDRPLVRLAFEMTLLPASGPGCHREPSELPVRRREIRSAFLSYASEDRSEVMKRAQGIRAGLPHVELFIDVLALRAGARWAEELPAAIERSDLLLLFWSEHAARSEWVEQEWRHALHAKGLDAIRPVPLEPPESVPPPVELAGLHFNDVFLMLQ